MTTSKKYLNRKEYDVLISKCKDTIHKFMLATPYTSLRYVPCDYEPDREFYVLHVPTMGDIEFRFNSFESDRASDRTGVDVVALPIIFKEYRNQTPFDMCGLSFNNLNGKCPLLAFASEKDKILTELEKVLTIASNVASQPFYWVQQGVKVWWDDPENETSDTYEIVHIPDNLPRNEWESDTIVLITNGTSEAEVPLLEIEPCLEI